MPKKKTGKCPVDSGFFIAWRFQTADRTGHYASGSIRLFRFDSGVPPMSGSDCAFARYLRTYWTDLYGHLPDFFGHMPRNPWKCRPYKPDKSCHWRDWSGVYPIFPDILTRMIWSGHMEFVRPEGSGHIPQPQTTWPDFSGHISIMFQHANGRSVTWSNRLSVTHE